MDIIIESLPSTPKAWLLNSALAPYLESYCAHFRLGRYATTTSVSCVAGLAHFALWVTQCGLAVEQLDAHKVEQFLNEHLPCCDCPKPVRRNHGALRAALGHLLTVLLEQGVIHAPPAPTGEIADELRRYDEHMDKSRGLSEGTRRGALYTVRQLLLHAFAGRPVVIAELKPDDVRKFIAARLDQVGTTSNAIMLASALRAYFRYRATCGDHVYGLLGVISSPAHWNLASLPRALKPDEVTRLLASFNASVPSPKRGYAIVRCALDLGLRSGEIAKLQLTDIDWRNGTVTIKRTKALRQDTLPLPAVTGQALADYVRFERPKTTNQAIFVRVQAPHDQPISPDAIHGVIRAAYHRIGLTHGRTHALRHTLACNLVNQGKLTQRGGRCATSSQPQHLNDLRQTGQLKTGGGGLALAWEYDMSARTYLQAKVDDYLAERRQLGFDLHRMEYALRSLVSYVERSGHEGALTADLMTEWARLDKKQSHLPATGARRIEVVRPFARWLCQFEPLTEVPDESAFGPVPGRVAPHIYREDEIVALLGATRDMEPKGGLRAATFETLFGLIASAGLRVSEALALLDSDVDLKVGALTVRLSKCKKSRRLPLHPSTVLALARYRELRSRQVPTTSETHFFVGTRGRLLGQPLGERQVRRVFRELRDKLGWVDRGCHGGPRIHDLRHTFAVRRVMLWHAQGIDVDEAMLSLSTYLGHAKISKTYWYLTGVPELMALVGTKFEHYAQAAEAGDE